MAAKIVNQNDLVSIVHSKLELIDDIIGKSKQILNKISGTEKKIKELFSPDGLLTIIVDGCNQLLELSKYKNNQLQKAKTNALSVISFISELLEEISKSKYLSKFDYKKRSQNIISFKEIIQALLDISKNIHKFALTSSLLFLSIPVAMVGMFLILGFIRSVGSMLKIIDNVINFERIKTIKRMNYIISLLNGLISKIGILALSTPLLVIAVPVAIIGVLLIIGFLKVTYVLLNWMMKSYRFIKRMVTYMSAIILIITFTTIAAAALMLLAVVSAELVKMIVPLLTFFGMLLGVIVIVTVIGLLVSLASPILLVAILGLGLLVALLLEIILITTILAIIQSFNLDKEKLKNNMESVFEGIDIVAQSLMKNGIKSFLTGLLGTIALAPVITLMLEIMTLIVILRLIQSFKMDKKKLSKNLDSVFEGIDIVTKGVSKRGVKSFLTGLLGTIALAPMLALMAEITLLIADLRLIQSFKMDKKKLDGNLNTIFESIDIVIGKFTGDKQAKKLRKAAKKNNRMLRQIRRVTGQIRRIGKELEDISNIKIDQPKITSSLSTIFNAIDMIEEDIKNRMKPKESGIKGFIKNIFKKKQSEIEMQSYVQELGRVFQIVFRLKNISDSLHSICELKLDKDKITNSLDILFSSIDQINDYIENNIKSRNNDGSTDPATIKDIIISDFKSMFQQNSFLKRLGRVGEIIQTLALITESLNSIMELKLDEGKINDSVDYIFKTVDDLERKIQAWDEARTTISTKTYKNFWGNKHTETIVNKKDFSAETDAFNEYAGRIGTVLGTIVNIQDSIKKITNITIDKNQALSKIDSMLEVIDTIQNRIGGVEYDQSMTDSMQMILDDVDRINQSFNEFKVNKEDADNYKSMISDNIRFLDKINSIDISKIQTTSNLFEHMAKMSESINGNFDGLADTLNEKIAPLIEELKEMMDELPKKIDEATSKISASKFAASNPNLSESEMQSQVTREGVDPAKQAYIIQQRMVDQLKRQNNNVTSKLDELIDIFRNGIAQVKMA